MKGEGGKGGEGGWEGGDGKGRVHIVMTEGTSRELEDRGGEEGKEGRMKGEGGKGGEGGWEGGRRWEGKGSYCNDRRDQPRTRGEGGREGKEGRMKGEGGKGGRRVGREEMGRDRGVHIVMTEGTS